MRSRRRAIGSRGETLMAPQDRQLNRPGGSNSTTPYPVYSVPQSMPKTRMPAVYPLGNAPPSIPWCALVSLVVILFTHGHALSLTASRTSIAQLLALAQKRDIGCTRRLHAGALEKSPIGGLVKDFAQRAQQNFPERTHPCSSVAKRVDTKGASRTLAALRPLSTRNHSRADSITITAIRTAITPVTIASSRSLKTSRPVVLVAGPVASCCACARNPMRGLGSKTL